MLSLSEQPRSRLGLTGQGPRRAGVLAGVEVHVRPDRWLAYPAPLQVDATQTTVVGRPRRGGSRWQMFPRTYSGGRRSAESRWC
jgi:hypothetical protein